MSARVLVVDDIPANVKLASLGKLALFPPLIAGI